MEMTGLKGMTMIKRFKEDVDGKSNCQAAYSRSGKLC